MIRGSVIVITRLIAGFNTVFYEVENLLLNASLLRMQKVQLL